MKSRSLVGMAQRARRATRRRGARARWTRSSKLPGVGRKTANVVLGHALGVPGLPVDRHVLRVANRHRPRALGRSGGRRGGALRAAAARAVDARVRHADPARPARLPAEAALRPLSRVASDCAYFRAARREGDEPRKRAEGRDDDPRASSGSSSTRRSTTIPARLSRRAAEHRHRRRRRAVDRAAGGGRHRAARHAARPLRRHAAHRAPVGARQHAAGQDHALSTPDRRRERRRGRRRRGDRRDADSRDRPLLRACPKKRSKRSKSSYWRGDGDEPDETRAAAIERAGGHRPRKRFGQHFLAPAWAREGRRSHRGPDRATSFLEIGPGTGALTLPLAATGVPILAVEIDRDLVARPRAPRVPPNVTILAGDVLKTDVVPFLSGLEPQRPPDASGAAGPPAGVRVVGNLPYNVDVADSLPADRAAPARTGCSPTRP